METIEIKEEKAIKVLISPSKNGFNCVIDIKNKNNLNSAEEELCTTIARGLVQQATSRPSQTFKMGLKAIKRDKKIISDKLSKEQNNVIDFYKYISRPRWQNLNRQSWQYEKQRNISFKKCSTIFYSCIEIRFV